MVYRAAYAAKNCKQSQKMRRELEGWSGIKFPALLSFTVVEMTTMHVKCLSVSKHSNYICLFQPYPYILTFKLDPNQTQRDLQEC